MSDQRIEGYARALFEIHKGTNKRPEIHVNSALPRELRRVPFEHMIYIADGPSDVPAWSVVRSEGGRAFGVYQHGSLAQFEQISQLQRDGRIHAFAEADYRPDSTAFLWLTSEVRRIAEGIVEDRELAMRRAVRSAPRHVSDAPATTPTDEPMAELAQPPAPAASPAPGSSDGPMPARSRADEIRDAVRRSMGDAERSEPVARPESERVLGE